MKPYDPTGSFPQAFSAKGKGRLKIYIGMSAGVGKTYRMLQEAHDLLQNGVALRIGYIETHGRKETAALLEGLPLLPRREIFYKGKRLEELDLQLVLLLRPALVIVDELAHTNVPGSRNEKRWQDVLDILDAGIDVITAVNIQHIESINDEVHQVTGIVVRERVPDRILQLADEIINIDLSADELIGRLRDGKIYEPSKIQHALDHFFRPERILQLRELALKEVAGQVERQVDIQAPGRNPGIRHERFLACISSNGDIARRIIRKTARLASYYNSQWYVLYVQTPEEHPQRIALDKQRHLINNFKNATELGATVLQLQHKNVAAGIMDVVREKNVTTLCIGKPHLSLFRIILQTSMFKQLLKTLSNYNIDLVILS